jgi:Arc/MetJ-type ribon-helix-helix transcriptional regulator
MVAVWIRWSTTEFSMTVLNPRSRKISVRLSEEEYSSLQRLCFATAERNVSDLTRRAMREFLSGTNRDGALRSDLDEFRGQMKRLDQRIEQLAAEFSTLKTD